MSVRCFRFWPDGRLEKTSELPDSARPTDDSVCWIDLAAPTTEEVDRLAELLDLDPHTTGEIRDGDDRANVDYFDHYTGVLMYGMLGSGKDDLPSPRLLNLICAERTLATVHDASVASLERVAARAERVAGVVGKRGVSHLLYLHLDRMVDNSMTLAKRYERELEALEDRSVDVNCEDDLLEDLADVRRRVLDLWQVQVAHREVLIELCENETEFLAPDALRRMEHVRDHMASAIEIVEILRGMVGEVRENYRTTLSLRSADAMNKLTVFAGLMLPVSVIAGVYGMNVPLWPDPTRPSTTWIVLGLMASVLGALTVYFRRRNWL